MRSRSKRVAGGLGVAISDALENREGSGSVGGDLVSEDSHNIKISRNKNNVCND